MTHRPTMATAMLLLVAGALCISLAAQAEPSSCPLHAAHQAGAADALTQLAPTPPGSSATAPTPSPHAAVATSELPALSPQQIADYLEGKGMGLAIPAEVHGYPGPRHVLELEADLALNASQRAKMEAVFETMQARARDLGARIVDAERRLDRLFRAGEPTPATLRPVLESLAGLQADLRFAHLAAHLEARALITQEQAERYAVLRGYTPAGSVAGGHRHGG